MTEKFIQSDSNGSMRSVIQAVLARQSELHSESSNALRHDTIEEESSSIKDYYNALEDCDKDEASFSSLPDYIVDTLLKADDDLFAEFLNARKLSKESRERDSENQATSSSNAGRNDQNLSEQLGKETDDNLLNSNDSLNPPPLILPPEGAIKYDESFIEMVVRVVNRKRDKDSCTDDEKITVTKIKEKGKERAADGSACFTEESDSIPRIEQARRDMVEAAEESLLLDKYSIKEDELLFLADDKIPSFLYKDDDTDPTSSVKTDHDREKKVVDKAENSFPRKTPHDHLFSIQFDDELDQSCDSIEAIHLGNEEEGIHTNDEESTEFIKDYSSWLCFDKETEYITFKESCGSSDHKETKSPKKQIDADQKSTYKQSSSDSEERSKSATPSHVPPEISLKPNSKDNLKTHYTQNELLNQDQVSGNNVSPVAPDDSKRDDNASNCTNETSTGQNVKSGKAVQDISKTAEKNKRDETDEEDELEGSIISPSSSSNSLNIESYIIATSTPSRNDSQQANNSKIRSEIFKTTPTKRRSQEDEEYNHGSSTTRTWSGTDYRSSPVRRRLMEAHAGDKNRNTTPSPPLVFPKSRTKSDDCL